MSECKYIFILFRYISLKAKNRTNMPATGRKKSGFEFSDKQLADINEAFGLFNKDGTGSIETKELKVFI
jgi:Ca2+-binding EF-hand superfamily protein